MVSVIIPVYNGELYLKEAVESVMQQDFNDVEIIIVDDGSTDGTKRIIQSLPFENVSYLYQENAGPSAARNTGIRNSTRDFIAFLDADDLWPQGKLAAQLSYLEQHKADAVGGLTEYLYMPGSEYRKEQLSVDEPLFNVQLGAWVIRRQVIEKIGFFDEQLRLSEDQDWLLRMREGGVSMHILDQVTLNYRIHPGNTTRHKTIKDLGVLKALKLSLDRRRSDRSGPLRPINNAS